MPPCTYADTVDGWNPAPVEVGSLSRYFWVFIHPRLLFGISSINSIIMDQKVPGTNPQVFFLRLAADTAKFVVADLPKLSRTLVPVVAQRFPPGKKAARIVGGTSLLLSPNLVGLAPSSYMHGVMGMVFFLGLLFHPYNSSYNYIVIITLFITVVGPTLW